MPQGTEEPPSIADSMDSFVQARGGTPEPQAEPQDTAPDPSPSPEKPSDDNTGAPQNTNTTQSDDLDLSGGIDAPKPEATPKTKDQAPDPDLEKHEKELEEIPVKKLRRQYVKTKSELENLQRELAALKAQPKTEETKAEIEAVRQEADALKKKLADVESEREQYAKQLAKADVANSPEFKEKYLKPWQEAQQQALDELSQYTTTNDKGEQVPISWADIKPLLTLPLKEATAKARELLGDDYLIGIEHRRTILNKQQEYGKALERHEAEAQNALVERSKQIERMQQTFDGEITRLKTEFPELYTPDEKNPREIDQVAKGEKLAKAAIFGLEGLNPETKVKAAAIVYQRAAQFPVLALRLSEQRAEIERLTKEVQTLKNGLPGGGLGSGGDLNLEETIGDSMDRFVKTKR